MNDPFDLTPSLYHELEQRARAILGMRRLVNQVCLKIMKGDKQPKFETRAEFLAFSAKKTRHSRWMGNIPDSSAGSAAGC